MSAMLDNTVIIIMFIINLMFLILGFSELSRVVFYLIIYATVLMDLGKKNISQKKAHGEAGALKLNFLDIILVTRLMKRYLIVDLSVVL